MQTFKLYFPHFEIFNLQEDAQTLFTDFTLYKKVCELLIQNWIMSPSKSLLHCFENIDFQNLPKGGELLTTDEQKHTQWVLLLTSGITTTNIFGNQNQTNGLNVVPKTKIFNDENGRSMFGGYFTGNFSIAIEYKEIVETVLKMVLHYIYNQKQKHITVKNKPKFVYRAIRFQSVKIDRSCDTPNTNWKVNEGGAIVNYLKNFKITDGCDGLFQSFTDSLKIARKFANNEGFIVKVELTNDMVISSHNTEPILAELNPYLEIYEKEYIIDVKYVKNFEIVEVCDFNTQMMLNDINCAKSISHDDIKILTTFEYNGMQVEIRFKAYWQNNNTLKTYAYITTNDEKFNETHNLQMGVSLSKLTKIFGKDFWNLPKTFEVYYLKSAWSGEWELIHKF